MNSLAQWTEFRKKSVKLKNGEQELYKLRAKRKLCEGKKADYFKAMRQYQTFKNMCNRSPE